MNPKRKAEYEVRDRLFEAACNKCARKRWCSFRDPVIGVGPPEGAGGPEAVCKQLIEGGTYNCESCLRSRKCCFVCSFFRPILPSHPRGVITEPTRVVIFKAKTDIDILFLNKEVVAPDRLVGRGPFDKKGKPVATHSAQGVKGHGAW